MNNFSAIPPKEDFIELGSFGQTHGLKGEVNFAAFSELAFRLSPDDFIFVESDNLLVPYRIVTIRPRNSADFLISVRGINSSDEASRISGCSVYANPQDYSERIAELSVDDDQEGYFAEDLIGFETYDSDGKHLGTVKDFDDSTLNVLLLIEKLNGDERFFIPFVEEYITEINPEGHAITVSLPEGFEDLN